MYRGQRLVGVIEAQMEAQDLFGKVLLPVADRPVLWHVLERLVSVHWFDELIVVTGDGEDDDAVQRFVEQSSPEGVRLFRGPDHDRLERLYSCLGDEPADIVVLCDGDRPLVSRSHVKRMIRHLHSRRLDFVEADGVGAGLPPGFHAQVYHHQALVDAHLLAVRPEERRCVSRFIHRRPHAFRIDSVEPEPRLCGDFRLTLDDPDDYRLMRQIYREWYRPGRPVECHKVVEWLSDCGPPLLERSG